MKGDATNLDEQASTFHLSPQQRRLWVLEPEGPTLHAQIEASLAGPLAPDALERALRTAVARYEILRTTFHRTPGVKIPFQVVHPELPPDWRRIDLASSPADQRDALIAGLVTEQARPFDLESGPLLRALLVRLAPDRHVLVLTLSALCADSASLRNLVWEIAAAYGGADQELGREEPLQFPDLAQWQIDLLSSEEARAERSGASWGDPGRAAPVVTGLPFQQVPGPGAPFAPARVGVTVERGDSSPGPDHPAASPSGLLAAWACVLARLSGDSPVTVWEFADGRADDELRTALGPLARPMPLVVSFDATAPFSRLVEEAAGVREAARVAQPYLPPDLAPGDDGGLMAAFEWTEAFPAVEAGGVTFSVDRAEAPLGRFGVKLTRRADAGQVSVRLDYDPLVLSEVDAGRLAGNVSAVLANAAADPDGEAGRVGLLTPIERAWLVEGRNRTEADIPSGATIHGLFEDQVRRTPDRTAVVAGEVSLTFAELNARANRLAHLLRTRGVGPDAPVGVLLDRDAQMVVAVLGILKAGGAYLPLHVEHPPARLGLQVTEARAPIVVSRDSLRDRLPAVGADLFCLDVDQRLLEVEPDVDPEALGGPDDLAYVIYTSGSTGTPKGVAISHRSLVNYATFIVGTLGSSDSGEPLRFALVSTFSTDLGNTALFPSLISGGSLHVVHPDISTDGQLYADYAAQHAIDVLKIAPSHLRALMIADDSGRVLPRRLLISGGEALPWELVDAVATLGSNRILNHYGPTETTVGAVTFDVDPATPRMGSSVPIGRPIANTQAYVLDPHMEPVPIGVAGELYIGGVGVARGYLHRPELTAERFVPDPFSPRPGARLYRTGDLARWLPDGTLAFLGRTDHQVKVRGFRVELGEIEAVLGSHPEVAEAVAVAREDAPGDPRLVAYVVPASDRAPTARGLRGWLGEHLPAYMVPSAVVFLPALPLMPNGKVDRGALPAPEQDRPDLDRPYLAPRDELEEEIAAIWSSVLGLERIGVQDDFFALGGHSLLATRIIARIRGAIGAPLPLHILFEHPTVEGLANAVREERRRSEESELAGLLTELEALSDEEAQDLLKEMGDE
jgi:amino acid adenylation domain-containing protein